MFFCLVYRYMNIDTSILWFIIYLYPHVYIYIYTHIHTYIDFTSQNIVFPHFWLVESHPSWPASGTSSAAPSAALVAAVPGPRATVKPRGVGNRSGVPFFLGETPKMDDDLWFHKSYRATPQSSIYRLGFVPFFEKPSNDFGYPPFSELDTSISEKIRSPEGKNGMIFWSLKM